jgi:hypothetical protein
MSKVDAMRALREARHAAAAKGAPDAATPRPSTQARPAPPRARAAAAPEAAVGLCGHRNMGGKSCTRDADHVQNGIKNHRYG